LSTSQRLMLGVAGAAIALAVWGVLAVKHFGLVWPYPQILPGAVHYQQYTYNKQAGCHSRRWYDRSGGVTGAERARRYGTLTSALGVGALPEYALNRHSLNGYLLVPSGGCFVMYETDAGG
jgi:hypothetical protein